MWKRVVSIMLATLLLVSGMSVPGTAETGGQPDEEGVYTYDIVIYGGNASGIIAAIQAAKMGKTVAVVEPNPYRIGGLTTGGLSDTDVGNAGVIGGLAAEFYRRVGKQYGEGSCYTFEPKVALQVLEEWVAEYKDSITVFMDERLDLSEGVIKEGTAIRSITTESGKVFKARMFLDCTYEGDLMAQADVSYTIGREANSVYGETLNGITSANNSHNGVPTGISPYVIADDPSSGLLPGVNADAGGETGDGDDKVQAYNFRWTLTTHASNRVPAEKPDNYDESRYELLFRAFETGTWTMDKVFKTTRHLHGNKVDSNNNSGISTDFIGGNYDYPEADYATREKIVQAHEDYQRGLLWALQNSDRIPENIHKEAQKWGLAADEFTENNNWPTQLYVREARRMVSDFVMTEQVCKKNSSVYIGDSVGMGSYNMDSHHIQYVVKNGEVRAEGDYFSGTDPYAISYRSLVPKANECTNLLVPVCVSASHAAYGSIRMEPVFMVLGQSAATAACIAIDENVTVQNVNYHQLAARLTADKQVLRTGSSGGDIAVGGGEALVYPIETLKTTTGPTALENGLFEAKYALTSQYNRVLTAAAGDYIEFEVPVEKPDVYTISAQTYGHTGRGVYHLYLPDTDTVLGGEYSQYGPSSDSPSRVMTDTFGQITVEEPTTLKLRFEVTAAGPEKGYTLAFCNIIFTPQSDLIVSFDANGGSKVTGQHVAPGGLATPPDAPERAGYTFAGWYADGALTQEWDFATDTVDENRTLYAKWEAVVPATYTVSFCANYGNGGSGVCSQHIAANGSGLVTEPKEPKREGYLFDGWYADAAYTRKWNFAVDTVTEDTVLYARWSFEEEVSLLKEQLLAALAAQRTELDAYTQTSAAAYRAVFAEAQAVYDDPDASAADITRVMGQVQEADSLLIPNVVEPIAYGDVDNSGGITVVDALMALQAAAGKIELTEAQTRAANVDGSVDENDKPTISANDALLILQRATSLFLSFPVENAG